jgi:DHA2 family multidrug resistance protein
MAAILNIERVDCRWVLGLASPLWRPLAGDHQPAANRGPIRLGHVQHGEGLRGRGPHDLVTGPGTAREHYHFVMLVDRLGSEPLTASQAADRKGKSPSAFVSAPTN